MFPNDYPAQGFGQQYPFNVNNGYYMNVPKRQCLPNYTAQLEYPLSTFTMTSQPYAASFYPQSYGYPAETTMVPVDQIEDRRRKTVQAIPDHERPIWTFTGLSLLALLNAKVHTATTDEIYTFVLSHFPFYIDQNHTSWTGAIRHNLTKKKHLFERNSDSKRNGKWTLISVEEAKKEISREIGKSKKNPKCGMENQDSFDTLIGRFLSSESTPTASSASPVLSALLSSAPIYYEECPVIQSDQITPIDHIGTRFQSEAVNDLEDLSKSSSISSDYVFNVPFYSEQFPIIQYDHSVGSITDDVTSYQSGPVDIIEDSPALSVEHLEFEIINDVF